MVFPVEISTSNESAVENMTNMRDWFDQHQVEPSVFRYSVSPPGLVFRIEFADEEQALAFAEAFGGHFVFGRTSPSDLESSPQPLMSKDGAAGIISNSTRATEGVSSFGEAERYWQEAASIRQAAEMIRSECFRDQLLSIAQQYEVAARSIEIELRRNERLCRTGKTEQEQQVAD